MRPKVLEIAWHEQQAIYSCDFQPLPAAQLKRLLPNTNDDEDREKAQTPVAAPRQYRLATCGGDSKVRLWMVYPNIPTVSASAHTALTGQEIAPHPPRVEYLATLHKHTAAVNVARFSPNGQVLASAGDDGNVILWVPSDRPVSTFGESSLDDLPDKEHWRLQKMLQVTTKHVYDLSWSPDGEFFIAGSTDNTATIWKASTGECVFALREHTHNVQGVSWDPLNEYIATQSSDRSVHVNTFAFRNGVPDVHPVSRASRMEIRHSRTPSVPTSARPNIVRRGSTASDAGSVITSASEVTDHQTLSVGQTTHTTAPPMTPSSTSVPSTPQPTVAMNPPPSSAKPGSRRSSFSSQQAASPALASTRGRSPSPMPPLPAIRAPPTTGPTVMQRLYGDEAATRFFRRLTFSPDGSLLFTPAGQIEDQIFKGSPMLITRSLSTDGSDTVSGTSSLPRPRINQDAGKPTVYIYSRANLARSPIAHLPGHKTTAIAIRFSPIFYDLRTNISSGPQPEPKNITLDRDDPSPVIVSLSMPPPPPPPLSKDKEKERKDPNEEKPLGSVFALPYRLMYAVACQDAILLYDTQQAGPIAIFRGLHYAGFTDIAWSPDGQAMMLSSSDGYCSIVVFDINELGTVHPIQQHHRQLAAIAQSHSGGQHHTSASATATPVPHSPSVSTMRQSPAPPRSERESSTSSSIAAQHSISSSVAPPLFPLFATTPSAHPHPPSSTASSVEGVIPTPIDEPVDAFIIQPRGASTSDSDTASASIQTIGLDLLEESSAKRASPAGDTEAPKKKRRVALTHLGDTDVA